MSKKEISQQLLLQELPFANEPTRAWRFEDQSFLMSKYQEQTLQRKTPKPTIMQNCTEKWWTETQKEQGKSGTVSKREKQLLDEELKELIRERQRMQSKKSSQPK